MPPKLAIKDVKEKVVKGDEAEVMILQYLRQVNRPYAATDISANLKGKVTKPGCQKALTALAEKGSLTMKTYGKQTIFVYPQADLPSLSPTELAELDQEAKIIGNEVDEAKKKLKLLEVELVEILAQPKTMGIEDTIEKIQAKNQISLAHLAPLRAASKSVDDSGRKGGQVGGMSSVDEIAVVNNEWIKCRKEWVERKKVYMSILGYAQGNRDGLSRKEFEEEVGIDEDPEECVDLENSALCKPPTLAPRKTNTAMSTASSGKAKMATSSLKRKRA